MLNKNTLLWTLTWVAIAALAAGMIWQHAFFKKTESNDFNTLSNNIANQQQALQQLTEVMTTHDEQFQQIQEHSNQVVASLKSLDKAVVGEQNIWKLMQVQNYLEVAVVEASLLHDSRKAIKLLLAAEQTLKQVDNPNALSVRKSIQEDIQMLQKQSVANIDNIILGLNIITEEVPNLPHKIRLKQDSTADEAPSTTKKTWKQRFENAWLELKSLIRIQKHDEPIKPYFSNNEVELINENLQLMLQQASFAAIRGNQVLFKTHIEVANKWLQSYFDLSDADVKKVQATLTELASTTVATPDNLQLKTIGAWSAFINNTSAKTEPGIKPEPTPEPEVKTEPAAPAPAVTENVEGVQ